MKKAMSKKVGAGGRFDIFLDSGKKWKAVLPTPHSHFEVLYLGDNGGTKWEAPHRGCIMWKVISKEVTAGGRFDLFLDSAFRTKP